MLYLYTLHILASGRNRRGDNSRQTSKRMTSGTVRDGHSDNDNLYKR